MSFLDSWLARQEGRDDSLSQNTQYPQNSKTGGQQGVFGDIGDIGNKKSTQPKPGTCRKRLTSPSQAGAIDWETLAAWKDEFPHMRPCPKVKNTLGDWLWVNRSQCQGCPWAVAEATGTLQ